MPDKERNINFRGTVEYRKKLAQAALDRGIKVQQFLEEAVECYLSNAQTGSTVKDDTSDDNDGTKPGVRPVLEPNVITPVVNQASRPLGIPKEGDILHSLGSELSDPQREFLRECLRIYESEFGKPLQENVTFFGIGLDAVQRIALLGMENERVAADADVLSPGEQRAFAIADNAKNANNLLKKATHDVVEELRRTRAGNPETPDGIKPRRKSGSK